MHIIRECVYVRDVDSLLDVTHHAHLHYTHLRIYKYNQITYRYQFQICQQTVRVNEIHYVLDIDMMTLN